MSLFDQLNLLSSVQIRKPEPPPSFDKTSSAKLEHVREEATIRPKKRMTDSEVMAELGKVETSRGFSQGGNSSQRLTLQQLALI